MRIADGGGRSGSGVSTSSTPCAAKKGNRVRPPTSRAAALQRMECGRWGASSRDAAQRFAEAHDAARAKSNGSQRARFALEQEDDGRNPCLKRAEFGTLRQRRRRGPEWRVITRRAAGVISPAHTVAMLPTLSAPTSTSAKPAVCRVEESQDRVSLRANRPGTCRAVTEFTLNRRPGNVHSLPQFTLKRPM